MISLCERDNKIAYIIELELGGLKSGTRQSGQARSIEQDQRVLFTTREPIELGESMGVQYSIKSDGYGHFNITDVRPANKKTTRFTAKRIR